MYLKKDENIFLKTPKLKFDPNSTEESKDGVSTILRILEIYRFACAEDFRQANPA